MKMELIRMRLIVDQVGRINHASVALDGITVLVGANNTGKSSLGKSLFALIDSFRDFPAEKHRQMHRSIRNRLRLFLTADVSYRDNLYRLSSRVADDLTDVLFTIYHDNNDNLSLEQISEVFSRYRIDTNQPRFSREKWSEEDLSNLTRKIHDIQQTAEIRERIARLLALKDDDFASEFISSTFRGMFDGQVTNLITGAENAHVKLLNHDRSIAEAIIPRNGQAKAVVRLDRQLRAIILDDPRIADDVFGHGAMGSGIRGRNVFGSYEYERLSWQHLADEHMKDPFPEEQEADSDSTVADMILTQQDVNVALQRLNQAYPGKIIRGEMNSTVLSDDAPVKEPVHLANASMGSKAMMLIRYLFEEGKLHEGDFLILDEPEIHLHPHWQISYARFIVTVAQRLGVRILIATHSPYFLQALVDYSRLHEFTKQTVVYSSVMQQDETISFKQEDESGIARIFTDMAAPFIQIEQDIANSLVG
ncbi:AAA family ATPase [Bifidobacterium ramosum]|nr:AAA family ATPase [Bifidobacterium ramosum]